jgi:hypothetical protein
VNTSLARILERIIEQAQANVFWREFKSGVLCGDLTTGKREFASVGGSGEKGKSGMPIAN